MLKWADYTDWANPTNGLLDASVAMAVRLSGGLLRK